MEKNTIFNYMIALRGYFQQVVKPGVDIDCVTFLYKGGGAVRIQLNRKKRNKIEIIEKNSINDIAKDIHLDRFIQCNDYSCITFGGTNVFNNGDEIIFIKDDQKKEWTKEAAKQDLLVILRRGKQ